MGRSVGCCTKETKQLTHITLFVIALITLTLTIFLALVSAGAFAKSYPLYYLGNIAPFGSGVLVTLAAVSTLTLMGILIKNAYCMPQEEYGRTSRSSSLSY